MTAIADLTLVNALSANVTFKALVGAGSDGTWARWAYVNPLFPRNQHTTVAMMTRPGEGGKSRRIESVFTSPVLVSTAVAGVMDIGGYCSTRQISSIYLGAKDTLVDDHFALAGSFQNLAVMRALFASGYSPT